MAAIRCWGLEERAKDIDFWLNSQESGVAQDDPKMLDIYDEANEKISEALKEVKGFKWILYAIVKYALLFFVLFGIIGESLYGGEKELTAGVLAAIITLLYREKDLSEIDATIARLKAAVAWNKIAYLRREVEALRDKSQNLSPFQ